MKTFVIAVYVLIVAAMLASGVAKGASFLGKAVVAGITATN